MKASSAVGANKVKYDLSRIGRDFGHDYTAPLKGKKIVKWGILYHQRTRNYKNFTFLLQQAVQKDFLTKCSKPLEYEVGGKDFDSRNWTDGIRKLLKDGDL